MKKFVFLTLSLLYVVCCFGKTTEKFQYGLRFNAHQSNLDKRTGLSLNPRIAFSDLKEGFSISFDIQLRKEVQNFGYILRMLVDEKSSFDFLSNVTDNEFNFVLNNKLGKHIASKRYRDQSRVCQDKWIPIKLTFFKNRVLVDVHGQQIELNEGLEEFENITFHFGANKTKYFHTTEVPPFTLRNIKIVNDGELLYHWILAKHNQQNVYDEVSNTLAKAQNGDWLISSHAKWQKLVGFDLDDTPQIAFDQVNGRIFMVTAKKVTVYHVRSEKTEVIDVAYGNPFLGVSRQIVYHPKTNQLISYTTQTNELSFFSFATKSWSLAPSLYVDSRQHHNHFVDTATNTLKIMMGYGYHIYNTDLQTINLGGANAKEWITTKLKPSVSPRYLSALGVIDDSNLLLLGGYGSLSGRQEEFPHNFYDLHQINPKTGITKKLWELKIDTPYIVFSNSMHVDKANNKIYALGYNNFTYKSALMLYGFDIDTSTPSIKTYGNALPFNFLDIASYCDLYFDSAKKKLFAITSHKKEEGNYEVNIYGINFPVFNASEIVQTVPNSFYWSIIFYLVGLSIIACACVLFFRIKALLKQANAKMAMPINKAFTQQVPITNTIQINLIGGFQFIGKDGVDYTGQFTPILKQIFIFLLLNSIDKAKQGVSSHILDQTFWPGMQQEKAINNRSVNIRKLRILLATFGEVELISKNGYWLLSVSEEIICDYRNAMYALKVIDDTGIYDSDSMRTIIANASKGKLIPSLENEWVDIFKSSFNNLLAKVLLSALKDEDFMPKPEILLKIVDIILLHDSLEENAMIYKVKLLYSIGQKGQSKHAFDKYCTEYQQTLSVLPNLVYNEIIGHK